MRGSQRKPGQSDDQDRDLALKWAESRLRRAKAGGDRAVMVTPRILSILVQAARAVGEARSTTPAAA